MDIYPKIGVNTASSGVLQEVSSWHGSSSVSRVTADSSKISSAQSKDGLEHPHILWKPTGHSMGSGNICEWTDTTVTQCLHCHACLQQPHSLLLILSCLWHSSSQHQPSLGAEWGVVPQVPQTDLVPLKTPLCVSAMNLSFSNRGTLCSTVLPWLSLNPDNRGSIPDYECLLGFKWNLGKMVTRCMLIGKTISITQQCRNCRLIINWKTELLQQGP